MTLRAMRDCAPGSFMLRAIHSFFFGERKVGCCLAAGAAVLVGTLKIVASVQRKNRRKKWDSVGKDKVVLHMFPRGRICPNLSPFVLKLETYLRMVQIPYEVDFEEPVGPKGKSPWITLNGEEFADSQLIMEKLGPMFNKDLSAHLSEREKAVGASMRIMLEEHFLWCLVIWRYITDECNALVECMELPRMFKVLVRAFKGQIKKAMYIQGMGRHTEKELVEFGRKDLLYMSTWLDEKPYFMGDEPTEVDCAIFGMLAQIEWNSSGSPYQRMLKGDFKNLSDYCHRVKEKYWPDWNQCLNPPQP